MVIDNGSGERAFASVGRWVLMILGLPLVIMFLRELVRHNLLLQLLIGWVLINLLVARFAERWRFNRLSRLSQFLLWIIVSAVLVAAINVPITSISLDVKSIPVSSEFALTREGDQGRAKALLAYRGRSPTETRVSFLLRKPIERTRRSFVVHFGTHPHPYDIVRLTYGTDFLLWRIPLAIFEGEALLQIAKVNTQGSLSLSNSHVRLASTTPRAPGLIVPFDEGLIRKATGSFYLYAAKLLWFLLFAAISFTILWFPSMNPKVSRVSKTVRNYLES